MRLLRSASLLLLALLVVAIPASSRASVFISVGFAPPILPVYEQPICPEPDLMWTPGYWAYGPDGYYWVPGAWVPAPYEGALWTPGYWGWGSGLYLWHEGYWGRHIGYYGGVNYGFGYMGIGFAGGEWRGGHFAYNTAVVHVNTTIIRNTYVNETIVHNTTIVNERHVAYNGGPGGIHHEATNEERAAQHEEHVAPTHFQQQHIQTAQSDKSSYVKTNGGHPRTLAVTKPLPREEHTAPVAHPLNTTAHTPTPAPHAGPAPRATPESHGAPIESRPVNTPHQSPAPRAIPESHNPPAPHPQAQPRPEPQSRPAPEQHAPPAPHNAPRPEPKHEPKGRAK